jgi:hypothetical protein
MHSMKCEKKRESREAARGEKQAMGYTYREF